MARKFPLHSRDWVEVKSPAEIAQTLSADGALDGLPFMAEMIELCGRRFQVERLAEKTCVEYTGYYGMREFRGNDVVVLETPRCSGASHDGCQRLCVFFWKTAWLRKVDASTPVRSPDQSGIESLRAKIKSTNGPDRYFCQSTELDKATQPLSRGRTFLKCWWELRSGSRTLPEMLRAVAIPLFRNLTRYKFLAPRPLGKLKRTPVGDLNLQPGDRVQVKTMPELETTTDSRGRNRGLSFHSAMHRYIGCQFEVEGRLDRMISEPTGHMKTVEGTVMLKGLTCPCTNHVGGCPRKDYSYWREVWLKRVGPEPANLSLAGQGLSEAASEQTKNLAQ